MNLTILTNTTDVTVADSDKPGTVIISLFGIYYAIVFLIGIVGNILIIASVCTYKHMKTVVNGFLLNLAIADLLFSFCSTFDSISFIYGEWKIGDIGCRLQSLMIEVSYTVSVLTLVAVALERYISICYPYRRKRTFKQSLSMSAVIWVFGVLFCSALLHGYTAKNDNEGKFKCKNENWSDKSRRIFYITHSLLVYLLPLSLMCFSHYKISKALIHQQRYRSSTIRRSNNQVNVNAANLNSNSKGKIVNVDSESGKNNKRLQTAFRRVKIIKLLIVVTIIFFILWTPFIFTRLLLYFDVHVHDVVWRATQLTMFANTAVNCIVYALMSPAFKAAFKGLFTCVSPKKKHLWINASVSRSVDFSETMKKQTTIDRAVVNRNE